MAAVAAAASAAPPISAEQSGREAALLLAAILDGVLCLLLLLAGVAGNSLTSLAESLRGSLMWAIDLAALALIRRLHRGRLSGFDYGTGKIEQLCSVVIAFALGCAALWIGWGAVGMVSAGESLASPFGLSFAAVIGAANLYVNFVAWDSVRLATRGRASSIMEAQLRARTTKLISSGVVQFTMTGAALAQDPVLAAIFDAIGALMVCAIMIRASLAMLGESIPDLLDRSTNHVAGPALAQAMAALPASFTLQSFRSRGTARAFALEAMLACPAGTDVASLRQAEQTLAREMARLLPDVEIALSIIAAPAAA